MWRIEMNPQIKVRQTLELSWFKGGRSPQNCVFNPKVISQAIFSEILHIWLIVSCFRLQSCHLSLWKKVRRFTYICQEYQWNQIYLSIFAFGLQLGPQLLKNLIRTVLFFCSLGFGRLATLGPDTSRDIWCKYQKLNIGNRLCFIMRKRFIWYYELSGIHIIGSIRIFSP